jgi:ribose 5-phosphate isomerase A
MVLYERKTSLLGLPSLQDAIQSMVEDAARLAKGSTTIGLGSGSTAAYIVRELARIGDEKMEFVPTSIQIKVEAEKNNLRIADENRIPAIDIVFDGADQIDGEFNMIKGGGGALLREKILISSAKKVVILADESKFVKRFSRSVPIEVHPMARTSVAVRLTDVGGKPSLRTIDKGYPFITENGNVILDTTFASMPDPPAKEKELKNIAGVMEVGIFTRRADVYYKAKQDGTFEKIEQ